MTREAASAFIESIMTDSDTVTSTAGVIACKPRFDGQRDIMFDGTTGKTAIVSSPVTLHKIWITVSTDRPNDSPVMRAVMTVPASEFADETNLVGAQTAPASFIEAFKDMFGPEGQVNQEIAKHLPQMLQNTKKKVPIMAKVGKMPDAERLEAISDDCRLGFVSGGGTKPLWMNKQFVKLWHHTKTDAAGDDVTTSYAQLTLEIKKLFLPVTAPKSPEQIAADLNRFQAGSDLWQWQMANPDMAPNVGAVRINCADPAAGRKDTWLDLAYSMTDLSKSKDVWLQTHSCPWKTWILADRKRIVHSHFVNELDVYAVVQYESGGATKSLLNAKQRARVKRGPPVANEDPAKRARNADETDAESE